MRSKAKRCESPSKPETGASKNKMSTPNSSSLPGGSAAGIRSSSQRKHQQPALMASRRMTTVQDNALHYYRRSSSYDADAEDDDEEDVNASLLPGMPIRAGSVVSIMNSSSIFSGNDDSAITNNSMMYSEDERGDDDDDDDGSASDLSSVASISSSSTIHYNPTTITSGVFLDALDDASSFESSSEESSLFSQQDHYFSQGADDTERTTSSRSSGNDAAAAPADGQEPALLLSQSRSLEEKLNVNPLGEDRNSRSFEEYIFSDDDGSTGSSTTTQRQELMPKDEKDVTVNDAASDAATTATGFLSKSKDSNAASVAESNKSISPETWQHYNEERGRRMARQMLSRANNGIASTAGNSSYEVDTASMALEEEQPGHGSPSPRLRHSNEQQQQPQRRHSSFLGRVFFGRGGKRFTRSPSPLDAKIQAKVEGSTSTITTTPEKYNPHRVSDLAVSAALQQKEEPESPSSSAGDKRNRLVDFEAWEAALAAAHQQRMNHSPSSVIPEGEDEGSSLWKGANDLDHSSERASVDFNDDDDEKSVLFIKSVSLTAQDFIPKKSFSPSQPAPDMRLGLEEPRWTSEDIAVALDLQEDEALELLTHIRGRAGIIDDLGSDTGITTESSDDTNVLPWIHLQDNVWMPHYEEYVVRAVHLFQRRMMEAMAAATPDAPSNTLSNAAATTHSRV